MFLVAGATGNVGSEVARQLVAAGHPVRGLVREDSQAGLPDGVQPVVGDLDDPAGLVGAFAGVAGAFLLPGYADMPGLLGVADKAGVRHVVQLSGGSAESGDMSNAITAYMVRTEDAVRDSGVPWTILRPSAFMSNALRWLPQINDAALVRAPFPDVRTAVIDPADIAAVALTALTEPGHEGSTYRLSGPESLLPAEQVRILSDTLGRGLGFEGLTNEQARQEMEAAGVPAKYVDAFFDFYVAGSLDESRVYPTVRDVTGREPRTFAQWAADHSDAFTTGGAS